MSSRPWDVRLRRVTWQPVPSTWSVRRRVRILILLGVPCAVWYFGWLLNPPDPCRYPVPLRHPDRCGALQPDAGARLLVDRRQ